MILNGLGWVNRALYLMPHFFKDKPVERLLGAEITAEQLNDDTHTLAPFNFLVSVKCLAQLFDQ